MEIDIVFIFLHDSLWPVPQVIPVERDGFNSGTYCTHCNLHCSN